MKLVRNLKFLVLLLVILSVFTARVKRTKTQNKVATRLKAWANVKSNCYELNKSSKPTIENIWLLMDTQTMKTGSSGLIVKNYYSSESFNCAYMSSLGKSDGQNKYFFSYRDFSSYDVYSKENNIFLMRQLKIPMKNNVYYIFNIDKGLFSDDITDTELTSLVSLLKDNRNRYSTTYDKYVNQMRNYKIKAQALAATKAKNISTRQQLDSEIENKKAELILTQETLKDLNSKSSASSLQIRNLISEINKITADKLQPEMESLKGSVQTLDALTAQVADNNKKLLNIVKIDSNDLATSLIQLKEKLTALKATYLDSDPNSATLSSLIANFEVSEKFDSIPTLFE